MPGPGLWTHPRKAQLVINQLQNQAVKGEKEISLPWARGLVILGVHPQGRRKGPAPVVKGKEELLLRRRNLIQQKVRERVHKKS